MPARPDVVVFFLFAFSPELLFLLLKGCEICWAVPTDPCRRFCRCSWSAARALSQHARSAFRRPGVRSPASPGMRAFAQRVSFGVYQHHRSGPDSREYRSRAPGLWSSGSGLLVPRCTHCESSSPVFPSLVRRSEALRMVDLRRTRSAKRSNYRWAGGARRGDRLRSEGADPDALAVEHGGIALVPSLSEGRGRRVVSGAGDGGRGASGAQKGECVSRYALPLRR